MGFLTRANGDLVLLLDSGTDEHGGYDGGLRPLGGLLDLEMFLLQSP